MAENEAFDISRSLASEEKKLMPIRALSKASKLMPTVCPIVEMRKEAKSVTFKVESHVLGKMVETMPSSVFEDQSQIEQVPVYAKVSAVQQLSLDRDVTFNSAEQEDNVQSEGEAECEELEVHETVTMVESSVSSHEYEYAFSDQTGDIHSDIQQSYYSESTSLRHSLEEDLENRAVLSSLHSDTRINASIDHSDFICGELYHHYKERTSTSTCPKQSIMSGTSIGTINSVICESPPGSPSQESPLFTDTAFSQNKQHRSGGVTSLTTTEETIRRMLEAGIKGALELQVAFLEAKSRAQHMSLEQFLRNRQLREQDIACTMQHMPCVEVKVKDEIEDRNSLCLLQYRFMLHAPIAFSKALCVHQAVQNEETVVTDFVHSLRTGALHHKQKTKSSGKSGARFYYSNDRRYILKEVKKTEKDLLLKRLISYVKYLMCNPNTFLPRFYGLFTLDLSQIEPSLRVNLGAHLPQLDSITFLVMNNVLYQDHTAPGPTRSIREVYDLKGSIANRFTSLDDADLLKTQLPTAPFQTADAPNVPAEPIVLKDLNLKWYVEFIAILVDTFILLFI